MARESNFFVDLTNTIIMLVGISAIVYSIYMFKQHDMSEYVSTVRTPLLTTGIILFVLSLIGIIGSCFKNNVAMISYMILLFIAIVALIVISTFVFVVTYKGTGHVVSGPGGYKEYKTVDFSNWLQGLVDGKKWVSLKGLLVKDKVCNRLSNRRINLIKLGCCKPPPHCNFKFKNATFWIPPTKKEKTVVSGDCGLWSNKPKELCFSCDACKASVLASFRQEWRAILVYNVCFVVLLIILYFSAGCARRNNLRPNDLSECDNHDNLTVRIKITGSDAA